MRILLLDNYDSFTYNLEHYLYDLHQEVEVIRNDKLRVEDVAAYDAVVFSPGPGVPKNAGLLMEIIDTYQNSKPMLGICLGMQAMAEVFGGSIHNMDTVFHGTASVAVTVEDDVIFKGLPTENTVGRYHSWEVCKPLPDSFKILAEEKSSGTLMAIRHKTLPIWGLQFHPESILTPNGKNMLSNWLEAVKELVLAKA